MYSLAGSCNFGSNNWCLKLQPVHNGILTSVSSGEVHLLGLDLSKQDSFKIGETSINALSRVDGQENLFAASNGNKVKVFDLRENKEVATLEQENGANVLSLGSGHGMLAYGSEQQGVDAHLHLFDIRNWSKPVRSFVDSHQDDITSIAFHPADANVLLSGSTDGYTNVYDLLEPEEEDALHQVINYASIHSCGWLASRRIFTLSHMETFAIHELNDKSEELREPQPLDFGDIRQPWDCNYVVDIYPGYISAGVSEEGKGALRIIPFRNEHVQAKDTITISQAHGDEIVRDTYILPSQSDMLYSCGEDGQVKAWRNDIKLDIPETFWDYSTKMSLLSDEVPEVQLEKQPVEVIADKSEKRKNKKKKKHSKKNRFKPY